jgi:inorganic pyrophosphatase
MSALPRPALHLAFLLCLSLPVAAAQTANAIHLPGQAVLESKFLVATYAMNPDATLNVVIDQPLGGSGKTAPFLALGRIPRSILASGEPVTAIVLGATDPGATLRGRALGLLTRTQDGRTEYRVVLAPPDGPCGRYTTLDQLEKEIPALRTGFRLAFGPTTGTASFTQQGRKDAVRFVGDAVTAFESALVQEADKRPLGQDGNPMLYRWPGARNAADSRDE